MMYAEAVSTLIQEASAAPALGKSANRFALVATHNPVYGSDYRVLELLPGESLMEGGDVLWSVAAGQPLADIHAFYREVHAAEFASAEWLTLKDAAAALDLTKQAVNLRLHEGRWPLGHAKAASVPMQPRPAWFVTRQSVEAVASGAWDTAEPML